MVGDWTSLDTALDPTRRLLRIEASGRAALCGFDRARRDYVTRGARVEREGADYVLAVDDGSRYRLRVPSTDRLSLEDGRRSTFSPGLVPLGCERD